MKHIILSLFILSSLLVSCLSAEPAKDEAARLFDQSKKAVFQVRVIDLSNNEKSSTGSGFFIDKNGYAVTNFHVVSSYVNKPNEHKIEIVDSSGEVSALSLISFDIIHDLAILVSAKKPEGVLVLGNSNLQKGEKIFSMGNPYDLGMTIIEGTFNGLMEQSIERKILFSSSLNPGMSGGPAFNHLGEIVGVNVSTMGNDVSFLVPVEYLKVLIEKASAQTVSASTDKWDQLIENQMIENQKNYIDVYLAHGWKSSEIGDYMIPGQITPYVRCWGQSKDDQDRLVFKSSTRCSSDEYISINDDFYSAVVDYWFYWHRSKDLNSLRLYAHLQKDVEGLRDMENAGKEDVEKFNCETNFVRIDGRTFKSSICARQYKRFRNLYDMSLFVVSVDEYHTSLLGGVTLQGVTKDKGMQFLEHWMKEIKWKK